MSQLSIGIPVYNQAATIAATIESALTQLKPAHEVVVSENHSDDGTRQVVESYRRHVRIVRPPKFCSMAANWNHCVRACTGRWVGLCSGDDWLLPGYVAALGEEIEQHPQAVFVMGGWQNLHEATGKLEPHCLLSMGHVTRPPRTIQMQLRGPKASFAAFCFKRSAFDQVGGYDERFHLIQDWIFQFDLAKLGSFIKSDKLIARYRCWHRPTLTAKRQSLHLEDRIRYLSVKIWEALDYGVTRSRVNSAGRHVLFETLRSIRAANLLLDGASEAALSKVAAKCGGTRPWERWKAGDWVPSEPAFRHRWLRVIARKMFMLVR
jgi:glycosyltransferase involved in cell wall biosynthesis